MLVLCLSVFVSGCVSVCLSVCLSDCVCVCLALGWGLLSLVCLDRVGVVGCALPSFVSFEAGASA